MFTRTARRLYNLSKVCTGALSKMVEAAPYINIRLHVSLRHRNRRKITGGRRLDDLCESSERREQPPREKTLGESTLWNEALAGLENGILI